MGPKFVSQSIKKLKSSLTKRASKIGQIVESKAGVQPIVDIETKNIPFDGSVDGCVEVPDRSFSPKGLKD
ncbi:hypothetical protein CEXT_646711 [Caerostris extrusa]|uniref:Uncharacterized protein n=1 Tax=Caerostris extrusa TaxID=172846 RepID=A0AAV4QZN7_CAEEX|nr:hypothetical protein CEXT_646711 [Caerostris extrusa]